MIDNELNNYRDLFLSDLLTDSQANQSLNHEGFFRKCIDLISDDGAVDEPIEIAYVKTKKGISIHAYNYGELDGALSIFTHEFIHLGDWEKPQPRSDVIKRIQRAIRFVEKAGQKSFIEGLEESHGSFDAAKRINNLIELNHIKVINAYYFTDGVLSENTKDYLLDEIHGIKIKVKPYDIQRFKGLDESESGMEDFEVNFEELCGGIAALEANETGLKSYLAIMPGSVLSQVYENVNQKLLESNVRTFLDFRGKVNRGIKTTLKEEPEKFFAYNNGLTVTATNIEVSNKGSNGAVNIKNLTNMQIVNGGQTTCAIFFSPKEKNYTDIDLSKVFVPMKLTIINAGANATEESLEEAELFKAKVSEFANSQNAVNQGDLQSNHDFHIRMEKHSRRILAPHNESGIQTKWFYERTRGQWTTSRRVVNSPKQFERQNPKKQVFTKTDMAKYENTWRMRPYDVSKGAQKNLMEFYKIAKEEFSKDENQFREQFFKSIIAKKILFNSAERIISSSSWYISETYTRPFIVAYSISLIRYLLTSRKNDLDFSKIYEEQCLEKSLAKQLDATCEFVFNLFQDASFRNNSSYREWAVKESCWERLKLNKHTLDYLDDSCVLSFEDVKSKISDDKHIGQVSADIELALDMFQISPSEWSALVAHQIEKGFDITDKEISIPQLAINMLKPGGKIPSEKQMTLLESIYKDAIEDGFYFDIK
mgnify:FL=1|tara:strand:- start:159 stop:2282 length:2124 start_codon:yes stop_codon:yes gene_type:complete